MAAQYLVSKFEELYGSIDKQLYIPMKQLEVRVGNLEKRLSKREAELLNEKFERPGFFSRLRKSITGQRKRKSITSQRKRSTKRRHRRRK